MTEAIVDWLGEPPELVRVVPVHEERRLPGGRRLVVSSLEIWTTEVRWHVAEFPPPDMAEHQRPLWPAWSLSDDVGTEYIQTTGGGGGSDRWWHATASATPGAPPSATKLLLVDNRIPDEPMSIVLR